MSATNDTSGTNQEPRGAADRNRAAKDGLAAVAAALLFVGLVVFLVVQLI